MRDDEHRTTLSQGPAPPRTGSRHWYDLSAKEQDKYILACFDGPDARECVERELDLFGTIAGSIGLELLRDYYERQPPDQAMKNAICALRQQALAGTLLGVRLRNALHRAAGKPVYTPDPMLLFSSLLPASDDRSADILDEGCVMTRQELEASVPQESPETIEAQMRRLVAEAQSTDPPRPSPPRDEPGSGDSAARKGVSLANITRLECAGLLAIWLEKRSSPDAAKELAKEIGYNDSPYFGAAKKRARLVSELVTINVALAIYAVNQRFERNDAKAIIDPFLASANECMFKVFEKHDSKFKARYSERMTEYFKILHESQPALGLSLAFMMNCGLNPVKNLEGQLNLAGHFIAALKGTMELLGRLELEPSRPRNPAPAAERDFDPTILQRFECEIETWPPEEAAAALHVVRSTLNGDRTELEEYFGRLTVGHLDTVTKVVREIHGDD